MPGDVITAEEIVRRPVEKIYIPSSAGHAYIEVLLEEYGKYIESRKH